MVRIGAFIAGKFAHHPQIKRVVRHHEEVQRLLHLHLEAGGMFNRSPLSKLVGLVRRSPRTHEIRIKGKYGVHVGIAKVGIFVRIYLNSSIILCCGRCIQRCGIVGFNCGILVASNHQ